MAVSFVVDLSFGTIATGTTPQEEPWPPHPRRLFGALVAAAGAREAAGDAEADQLWQRLTELAEARSPSVWASPVEATETHTWTDYPPSNALSRKDVLSGRGLVAREIPAGVTRHEWVPAQPRVVITWPLEVDEVALGQLGRLARGVGYLGRSHSPCQITVTGEAPEAVGLQQWAPEAEGEVLLQVPGSRAVERLQRAHQRGGPPELAYAYAGYTRHQPADGQPVHYGPWDGELVAWQLPPRQRPSLLVTARLTRALRARALDAARQHDVDPAVYELLSGHTPDGAVSARPHVAWLPLADVGHAFASGTILGVAAALPRPGEADGGWSRGQLAAAAQVLGSISELAHGEVPLQPLAAGAPERPWALRSRRWTARARRWTTVTPMALPGRQDLARVKRAVRKSCQLAGYPRPDTVVQPRHPATEGAPPLGARDTAKTRGGPPAAAAVVDVILTFPEPVEGPVVLGPLRYFGIGLFAPADQPVRRP